MYMSKVKGKRFPSDDRSGGRSVVPPLSLASLLPNSLARAHALRHPQAAPPAFLLPLAPLLLPLLPYGSLQSHQWLWPQKLQIGGCLEPKRDEKQVEWNRSSLLQCLWAPMSRIHGL
jgi:hypothetical protein